ncbi:MAG: hypothetical protein GXO47_04720 [Chlorobi bacterium]|nr:hypothetical protein [Chlorobiota bacterium]
MLEYGKYYHIYNRGINSQKIFFDEGDYNHFLELMTVFLTPVVDVYAYVLMGNHFHFAVRIKDEDEIGYLDSANSNSDILMIKWKTVFLRSDEEKKGSRFVKKTDPDKMIQHLFSTYAKWFNKKNKRTGALLEHPYKHIEVSNEEYLKQLIIYIHNNPVKHGFCEHLVEYGWSSYLSMISIKPTKLARETVIGWFDDKANFIYAHKKQDDYSDDIQHLFLE